MFAQKDNGSRRRAPPPGLAIRPLGFRPVLQNDSMRPPDPPGPANVLVKSEETMQVDGKEYPCKVEDLIDRGEIGRGRFGSVHKMFHTPSGVEMAVKRLLVTVEERERRNLETDQTVIMKAECPFIVKFFGTLFREGEVWICMEKLDTSLFNLYRFVYQKMGTNIPEKAMGKIVVSVVNALNYLKEGISYLHRDVKPSNILINRLGQVKLCDFGISGKLVNSIAQTKEVGPVLSNLNNTQITE